MTIWGRSDARAHSTPVEGHNARLAVGSKPAGLTTGGGTHAAGRRALNDPNSHLRGRKASNEGADEGRPPLSMERTVPDAA